jgi:hypothetical protein
MAEIITLGNGTVIKNYPSFHENWDTHFNKLKESFDWIETYNTLMVQEPFIHEYFNELSMRTCLPRRICTQYNNDLFATCHRVHLLNSKKSRILLTEGYWVNTEDYPSWAENGIYIIAKSDWITEEGVDTTDAFDDYEEFYFRCTNNIASNSYGHTIDDDNDSILLSALVKKDGTVITYRKHETNTEIEDEEFLDTWAGVYILTAKQQGQKQFAKNLFASGLI